MSTIEGALGGPAIEVVAKATRRRFTLEYKRKIVREADGCKTFNWAKPAGLSTGVAEIGGRSTRRTREVPRAGGLRAS